ncbi:MAG TPA: hypothetical protein VFH32_01125 [Rubrobacteraceae bacterium]|nr:hypothetical protein [Rubrobacteraceae bacterium]
MKALGISSGWKLAAPIGLVVTLLGLGALAAWAWPALRPKAGAEE